jgi:SAM-dependent methyltransferase
MSHPTLQAQVEAARAYEGLFVPALFGRWTATVADAGGLQVGDHALDVACGTGVLARRALQRVGTTGFVAAVDPNPGMLQVARELEPAVEWREGAAEALPYPDRSFHAVISQFGLMFFTDPARSATEMLRVLTPRGRLAVAVWDDLETMPAYAAEARLLERVAGPAAAAALRVPFAMGDAPRLKSLFQEAGADRVRVTTASVMAEFPSVRLMVEADLRGWLPVMGVHLPEDQIQATLQEAEATLAPYVTPAGTAAFETRAHVVTGERP